MEVYKGNFKKTYSKFFFAEFHLARHSFYRVWNYGALAPSSGDRNIFESSRAVGPFQ